MKPTNEMDDTITVHVPELVARTGQTNRQTGCTL